MAPHETCSFVHCVVSPGERLRSLSVSMKPSRFGTWRQMQSGCLPPLTRAVLHPPGRTPVRAVVSTLEGIAETLVGDRPIRCRCAAAPFIVQGHMREGVPDARRGIVIVSRNRVDAAANTIHVSKTGQTAVACQPKLSDCGKQQEVRLSLACASVTCRKAQCVQVGERSERPSRRLVAGGGFEPPTFGL